MRKHADGRRKNTALQENLNVSLEEKRNKNLSSSQIATALKMLLVQVYLPEPFISNYIWLVFKHESQFNIFHLYHAYAIVEKVCICERTILVGVNNSDPD